MTTKPDDIPIGVWDSASDLAFYDASLDDLNGEIDRYKLREAIARANLKAKNDAYEEVMDAANEYMKEQYGNAALGHPVDRVRVLGRIRNLKHETEV